MLKDRSKKAGDEKWVRGERRSDQSPPIVRSPALESAERQSRSQPERSGRRPLPAPKRKAGEASRQALLPPQRGETTKRRAATRISYAAEDIVARPTLRKSLPRGVSARSNLRSGGILGGWRERSLHTADQPVAPVQVISEEEQEKLAELEMRLPRVAGKMDPWLLIIVLALLCIGLVMVYSASSFVSARDFGDASYYFQKQLLSAILGSAAMLVTMRVDYRRWRRFSLTGMVIILPLLVIVLIFGTSAYGASRWLSIGSFNLIQPSELTKLVLALYIADWLARKGNQVGTFLYGLAPFVILVGLILGLVLLEKDMGTAVIIAGLATVMFFTAGANLVQFLLALGGGGLIFLTQAFHGYRLDRLKGFMDVFNPKYITNINLQLYQSLLALGSGGWFGVGLGASRQKTGYLPFPFIDSIFAVIGEELGFIGCAIIVILFLFLAFRGFRLARRTQDVYGALLATGITTWLILQAMINIGSSTGSIPYTGVPLPFITYGGSSLVITMAAIGVLLNISRYIQEPEAPALSKRTITQNIQRKV